ncbi:MAG: (2,3-dihydroxybenzoyl)adenylate synthase [Brevibacterium aurantiacum]|uniref:2,3-dihydroxybenzoate-AMP ligase n=1 Tax=Brevibacterium aurantiacum TaxID=273384 RepID=A0A4Z0KGQ3_BREAU|nr:AMP-binding protein [Brevibacterium aurantiacum]TGD36385.1 2,3-dihydroxybenzoate-AMP ligase [Brevibacterium aurantiacum]
MTTQPRSAASGEVTDPEPLVLDGVVPYPRDLAALYREKGHWIGRTHAEMLFDTVSRHPDGTAVIFGEERLSYAELGDQVLRLAAGLRARGIRRGDRVVVHLPNIPIYLGLVFALFELGAIPVFALAAHRRSEIEYFLEFAEAKAYITVDRQGGHDLGALAAELRQSIPRLEQAIVVSGDGGSSADTDELLSHAPLDHRRRSLPGDIAFLQLSGGTTGRPKMIPRTHDDYLYSVRESNRICGVDQDTVHLVSLPISHNFTMSSPGILGVLEAGGQMVLGPNGSPDAAFPLIEEHRVTQAALVPPLAVAWLNSGLKDRYDLSSLRTLLVGGAKFSAEVAKRVRPELGCTLQQVFGMAEGLVNYTRLDDEEDIVVSTQGRPISPDDEVRVVDDEDRDVPHGEAGHLLTRGPYTIRGYYRAPEHNERSFTADGFYRTGDIVRLSPDGYITVVGRSKDQINRGGEKIAPEEVENLLLAHDAVHDASVVGIPDDLLGERSKAYVILRQGADPEGVGAVTLKRFLRARGLAAYKIPDVVDFVAEFPQTGVGKIAKRAQRASTAG